jgi:hypothetical protein
MANDPEAPPNTEALPGNETLPDEGMTPVFSSSNHDAEMEAMAIKGVLDSNNIPAMIVGPHVLPTLEFQVQVPQHLLAQARQLIREARQGGRQAASEAEAATE